MTIPQNTFSFGIFLKFLIKLPRAWPPEYVGPGQCFSRAVLGGHRWSSRLALDVFLLNLDIFQAS